MSKSPAEKTALGLLREARDIFVAYTSGPRRPAPFPSVIRGTNGVHVIRMPVISDGQVRLICDAIVGLLDAAGRPIPMCFEIHLEGNGRPARDIIVPDAVLNMQYIHMHGGDRSWIRVAQNVQSVVYANAYGAERKALAALPIVLRRTPRSTL